MPLLPPPYFLPPIHSITTADLSPLFQNRHHHNTPPPPHHRRQALPSCFSPLLPLLHQRRRGRASSPTATNYHLTPPKNCRHSPSPTAIAPRKSLTHPLHDDSRRVEKGEASGLSRSGHLRPACPDLVADFPLCTVTPRSKVQATMAVCPVVTRGTTPLLQARPRRRWDQRRGGREA